MNNSLELPLDFLLKTLEYVKKHNLMWPYTYFTIAFILTTIGLSQAIKCLKNNEPSTMLFAIAFKLSIFIFFLILESTLTK